MFPIRSDCFDRQAVVRPLFLVYLIFSDYFFHPDLIVSPKKKQSLLISKRDQLSICFQRSIQKKRKQATPARPTTDVLCGRARASLAHGGTGSCGLAPVQAQAQFSRLVGVKKTKQKGGRAQYTPHPNKKRRQTTSACCPFRVAVALPCVSSVAYLCRNMFFVDFSAATACYHCVHIVFLLHNFDRFSYSFSTTSC
jgi:hypothetical protein